MAAAAEVALSGCCSLARRRRPRGLTAVVIAQRSARAVVRLVKETPGAQDPRRSRPGERHHRHRGFGGSTNAVLHLLAIAHEARVLLDYATISTGYR
jgi:dihydroxyacid dehydratase/phosphogluconate dehydratase